MNVSQMDACYDLMQCFISKWSWSQTTPGYESESTHFYNSMYFSFLFRVILVPASAYMGRGQETLREGKQPKKAAKNGFDFLNVIVLGDLMRCHSGLSPVEEA